MYSKAKIGKHPIHPKLVPFPIVFYAMTFVAFSIYGFVNADIFWFKLAYFCNFAGVAMALLTAIPGFIDWAFGIPKGTAAKRRGLLHMSLNVATLILFAINAVRLSGTWDAPPSNVTNLWVISLLGFALTAVAGFHGWKLIAVHKVGVDLTPQQENIERTEDTRRPFASHPRPV